MAAVLGMRIDSVELDDAVTIIGRHVSATGARPARIVCAANVHMVMEAWDDPGYQRTINSAALVVPDGQPIVWALRLLGWPQERRVRVSPDLLMRLLAQAEDRGWALGLYGGDDETLPTFVALLTRRFPLLRLTFAWAPPFRPLTPSEDREVVARIRDAGVDLLLVGLGCPKQERWMEEHQDQLSGVMVGVGAAFDLLGGRTREAPRWTRDIGLEWSWRLIHEPRLWRRYAKHNPRFLFLLARQLLAQPRCK